MKNLFKSRVRGASPGASTTTVTYRAKDSQAGKAAERISRMSSPAKSRATTRATPWISDSLQAREVEREDQREKRFEQTEEGIVIDMPRPGLRHRP